jgi:meiosis induction protein kinase IME2/SME1
MTVSHDVTRRASAHVTNNGLALEDRFEVLKEIGDGSFGSVVLARVRSAGSNIARRGTVVCVHLMLCIPSSRYQREKMLTDTQSRSPLRL